ncbi:transcriptional regulator SlyA [Sebaldella termitidis]|jgi:DNA-binding MarR family transcriptional regulator|uniref:Transcriptional regulator, MarR family n=1 Tax=Sebaldella termitidis (strain ATCC 33386 / NCTC 11300) TaxID=526218 RepID=D1AHW0_SEBTE|nr:MarR family transcriptional regulator [Sebaldella termitidis]ACZ08344.1 transcriptional regulator, MarR family [Sebaldella termitidis ATCC 33386]SUI23654.1 transcriptional regulator SlyA [Sebaldella termitidis]
MEIADAIMFKIRILDNQIKRFIDKKAMSVDKNLTGMQLAVLLFVGYHNKLDKNKDIFPNDIEKKFNVRRSTVTTILKKLVKDGYITQIRASYDERYKRLFITEKSELIYSKIQQAQIEGEEIVSKGLSQEKIDIFFEVANKIMENIS